MCFAELWHDITLGFAVLLSEGAADHKQTQSSSRALTLLRRGFCNLNPKPTGPVSHLPAWHWVCAMQGTSVEWQDWPSEIPPTGTEGYGQSGEDSCVVQRWANCALWSWEQHYFYQEAQIRHQCKQYLGLHATAALEMFQLSSGVACRQLQYILLHLQTSSCAQPPGFLHQMPQS